MENTAMMIVQSPLPVRHLTTSQSFPVEFDEAEIQLHDGWRIGTVDDWPDDMVATLLECGAETGGPTMFAVGVGESLVLAFAYLPSEDLGFDTWLGTEFALNVTLGI